MSHSVMPINWSTEAPETRLYKGKNLYRWDVSPGLEHHCGICATPLHNARAKTSCIGKHVEPCYRFHQQLHFKGKSHECFSCNNADEQHHTRHKEILKLVRKISALDDDNTVTLTLTAPDNETQHHSAMNGDTYTTTDSSDILEDDAKLRRGERKKAKKMGSVGATHERKDMEVFRQADLDFISEALHLIVHESKGGLFNSYTYGERSREIEVEAAEISDVEMVTESTGRNTRPIASMTPRQRRNEKRTTTPFNVQSFSGGSRKFSPNYGLAKDPYNGLDPNIFDRLGVQVVDPPHNSVARKALISQLTTAVKEDLETIRQEDVEIKLRSEGFWRWAGKKAYHAIMVINREEIDWATGMSIKRGLVREPIANEEVEEVFLEDTQREASVEFTRYKSELATPNKIERKEANIVRNPGTPSAHSAADNPSNYEETPIFKRAKKVLKIQERVEIEEVEDEIGGWTMVVRKARR